MVSALMCIVQETVPKFVYIYLKIYIQLFNNMNLSTLCATIDSVAVLMLWLFACSANCTVRVIKHSFCMCYSVMMNGCIDWIVVIRNFNIV